MLAVQTHMCACNAKRYRSAASCTWTHSKGTVRDQAGCPSKQALQLYLQRNIPLPWAFPHAHGDGSSSHLQLSKAPLRDGIPFSPSQSRSLTQRTHHCPNQGRGPRSCCLCSVAQATGVWWSRRWACTLACCRRCPRWPARCGAGGLCPAAHTPEGSACRHLYCPQGIPCRHVHVRHCSNRIYIAACAAHVA